MRSLRVLVGVLVVSATLSGCGNERSAAEFCAVHDRHRDRYLAATTPSEDGNPFGDLVSLAVAVGDLSIMWSELAGAAPEEIRSDAEAVRDGWEQQERDSLDGKWLATIGNGILNAGAMTRVDSYIRDNCS